MSIGYAKLGYGILWGAIVFLAVDIIGSLWVRTG